MPSSYLSAGAFALAFALFASPHTARSAGGELGLGLVRQVPAINGGATVEGNLHMMSGGSITLNGGATITQDLFVPGTPVVRLNGKPSYGGTLDGSGPATPANYVITLNGQASLRNVIRRTAPVALPSLPPPPSPAGTRSVVIDRAAQPVGAWPTIRNLTLNGNVGQVAVPPGTYGDFLANGGSGFTLGISGSTTPATYNLQRLTLNGQARLEVVGPVILNLANGLAANGTLGSSARPDWLALNIASGGLTLNGGCVLHAFVTAPAAGSGSVIINGNSTLTGGLVADQLIVNGGGLLRLRKGGGGGPANTAPVAASQSLSTPEDTPLALTLTATDAENDPLTYVLVSLPSSGALTFADGAPLPAPGSALASTALRYVPAANFSADDTFTFRVRDAAGLESNLATVSIAVTPVNDAPVAAPLVVSSLEDAPVAITLSGSDPEGSALTYAVDSSTLAGSLTGEPPALTYHPKPDFFGQETFTYTVTDAQGTVSAAANVTITVEPLNDRPVAQARALETREDEPLTLTLAATDAENQPLSYRVVTLPSHGTLTLADGAPMPALGQPLPADAAGLVRYVPSADFHGTDVFTFVASDGLEPSEPAAIQFTVHPVNDSPVAHPNEATTSEDTPVVVALSGTDVDGDALTFAVVTPPAHGVVTLSGHLATYVPAADYFGPDSFAVTVSDGAATSAPATVALTVTLVNDLPVAQPPPPATTPEDTPLPITLAGFDADGDSLSHSITTPPAHGTLSGVAPELIYTPAANYHGPDGFAYTVADPSGAVSSPATVSLHVAPVNDVPVAHAAAYVVDERQTLPIALVATDADGDTLTYALSSVPAGGTLTLADGSPLPALGSVLPTPGSLLYTPPANTNATVEFAFVATDGTATSAPVTVTIEVRNVPDAPIAQGQTLGLAEDTSLALVLSASDPEGEALTYEVIVPPAHGMLNGTAPELTYVPDPNFHGTDTFTFVARDAALASAPAVVSLVVAPVNDAPRGLAQTLATPEDTPLALTLVGQDDDGDVLVYTISTAPAHGSLSGSAPHFVYTPAADYHGSDSLAFTVTDASGAVSAPELVTLQVAPVNDAPTATARSLATPEDTPLAVTLAGLDVDGDALSFHLTTQPAHGTLSGTAPELTYTPAADFHGTDSFIYVVRDGGLESAPAIISVRVDPANDAPAVADHVLALREDQSSTLLLQASDADGDALTFSLRQAGTDNVVTAWNALALDAVRLASRPVAQGGAGIDPTIISRALAIAHLAVFEAVNAVDRDYAPYDGTYLETAGPVSLEAAAARAAHDTLSALFPASAPLFASRLAQDLAAVSDAVARDNGAALGASAAARILALRSTDGAFGPSSYAPQPLGTIGAWQPADTSLWGTPNGGAIRPEWGSVKPFVLETSAQFAPPPPPALGSPEYSAAYSEVKTLGASTSPVRSTEQTETAYYWADGPGTYSPPGHWNAIASRVAARSNLSLVATARLLALVNLANADAAIACWRAKYAHDLWRPVTAVRAPDDGNPLTEADPVWSPLLGTPQFPSYPSGHSTFSAASAAVLSGILGDAIRITVPSEDPRAATRVVDSLSAAALEAGRSRVLAGIHYEFDNVAGRELGSAIGGYVLSRALLPVASEPAPVIQRGEASLAGATLSYTPPVNYHGSDVVPFSVSDGQAAADARVLIDIASENDSPAALPQAIALLEDRSAQLTLAAEDADGDALEYRIVTLPARGSLTYSDGTALPAAGAPLSGPGPLVYTPAADYAGTDTFAFVASDGSATSATAAVQLTILSVNDVPVAESKSVSTEHYAPVFIALSAQDADGDTLRYALVSSPRHGVLEPVPGGYLYRPRYAFWGQDAFSFTASDGAAVSAPALVSIAVLAPQVPVTPIVSLAPITPAPLPNSAFALRATALDADGSVARVEFYQGATLLGALIREEPGEPGVYAFLLPAGRPSGAYEFTAKVFDDQGLFAVSAPLSVVLVNDPRARTYTTSADFQEGEIRTLKSEGDELTTSFFPSAYDFVWVVNSSKGTVVRLDSETARVVGEYRASPGTGSAFPSRIAIDSRGNAFVANRQNGVIVKIGLGLDNGFWIDRDGDRTLDTSGGLNEVLPWPAGGQPVDEQILFSIQSGVAGLDHIAVDADDNLWVGPYSGDWKLYDGRTGELLRTELGAPGRGGRGGFIDASGIQVSTGPRFLRWDTSLPLAANADAAFSTLVRQDAWGVAKDSAGNYWVTEDWSGTVEKYGPDGEKLGAFHHGEPWAQGITIGKDGHIWVAHSHCGYSVGHLLPDGTWLGNVLVANHGPTEVSVDQKGRVWVVSTTGVVERINPLAGPIGRDGVTPLGEVDVRSPNLGGTLWTFGNFVGNRSGLFLQDGQWRFTYDGQVAGSAWGPVQWNAILYNDAFLRVEVSLSEDGVSYSAWQTLTLASPVPAGTGRYLRGRVTLTPASTGESPAVYDLTVGTQGYAAPVPPRYWRVSAGDDVSASWPDTVQLKGAFGRSDHEFPARPTYQWSLVSFSPPPAGTTGTAPAGGVPTFSDATDPRSTVTFNGVGDYVLRLTATLDGVVSTDDVHVHVAPFNKTPFVSAGDTVYLRDAVDSVTLAGIAQDDGLPLPSRLTLQWEKLFGPGTVNFSAPNAAVTDARFSTPGIYVLRLTGNDGEFSHSSTVTAWVGLVCRPVAPEGIVAWWQANADGADHVGGNQAFAENGAGHVDGRVGPAFNFDGLNDRVLVFGNPSLDVGSATSTGTGLGIEFWIRPSESREATILQFGRDAATSGFTIRQSAQNLVVNYRETSGLNHEVTLNNAVPAGTWTHLVITYDRASGVAAVYRNGSLAGAWNFGPIALDTRNDLRLGGNWSNAAYYKGQLDELAIYKRSLSLAEAYAISAAASSGKRPPTSNSAPVIRPGPSGGYVLLGANRALVLQGEVEDDTFPSGNALNTAWRVVAAPAGGGVVFDNAASPATRAVFSTPGFYTLGLSADDGALCSDMTVEVRVGVAEPAELPPGLVAWWPGNGTTEEMVQKRAETAVNATFGVGLSGNAWSFNGGDRYAVVSGHPEQTRVGSFESGFSIEFWAFNNTWGDYDPRRVLSWVSGASEQMHIDFSSGEDRIYLRGAGGAVWWSFAPDTQWAHYVFAYDRASGRLRHYRNGAMQFDVAVGGTPFASSGDLYIGGSPFVPRFNGLLDEVSIYNRALSHGEVAKIYVAGAAGKAPLDGNAGPEVSAGENKTLSGSAGEVVLQGRVSDDGLPSGWLDIRWEQVFGPTATFAQPTAAQTQAALIAPGLYGFRLKASDGLATHSDVVEVRAGMSAAAPRFAGLVGWWPANNENQEVVRGRREEGVNITYAQGKVGGAYLFDASNRNVPIPEQAGQTDLGNFGDGFTIEFWIQPEIYDTQRRRVLAWTQGGLLSLYLYELKLDYGQGGELSFRLNDGWQHMAYAYDRAGGVLRTYCNGSLRQTTTVSAAAAATLAARMRGQLYIGGLPWESGQWLKARLDELSFYNRPLSQSEITSIVAAAEHGKEPVESNEPPVVSAGADQVLATAPATTTLRGDVRDDGLPGGILEKNWEQVFGPAAATLAQPTAAQTQVALPAAGIYGFKLKASDGFVTRSDVMEVRAGVAAAAPRFDGLVGWWPANNENREMVRGRAEEGVNVTYAQGKVGGAYLFDASNRHVWIPEQAGQTDLGNFNEGFTIEFWIQPEVYDTQRRRVLAWTQGGLLSLYLYELKLDYGQGELSYRLDDGWQHIAYAYDRAGAVLRTYRDGILRQTTSVSAAGAATLAARMQGQLFVGGLPWEPSQWLKARLDELSFYDRPLSQSEIASIVTAGAKGKDPLPRPPVVRLLQPTSDATIQAGDPLGLSALVFENSYPVVSVAFYDGAALIGTVSAPVSGSTEFALNLASGLNLGAHTLTAVATDSGGLSAASAPVAITVTYGPPSVSLLEPANGATVSASLPITLRASASYGGGPIAKVEFFDRVTKLGERTAPDAAGDYSLVVPAGFTAGTHEITVKATAFDGAARVSAPINITASLVAPAVALVSPIDGTVLEANRPLTLRADATVAAGLIERVEFYRGAALLGVATAPATATGPNAYTLAVPAGFPAGSHVLTARAIALASGATTTSPPVNVIAAPYAGPEIVELSSPADGARITAPTEFTGLVARAGLASWKLEYRLTPANPDASAAAAPWTTFASGTDYVGTPASGSEPAVPGPLGTFDPTLRRNGLYQVRLSATSTNGTTVIAGPITVLVEGNMKVGAFSVAFSDLVDQTPGLPITLTRTYDSRDRSLGDFGPGWHLSLGNVRVQKNRHLGLGWYQTEPSGELGFISYFVIPVNERIVSVVMPDGETHRFRAGVYVKTRPGDDDNESFPVPALQGSFRFYPVGDTTSTLDPVTFDASGEPVLADRFWMEGTGDKDLYAGNYGDWNYVPYNPTQFRLTTADGTIMLLDQALGLLELRDRNGNRLVIHRHPASAGAALAGRIASIDSIQAHASGPITRTVGISRRADGRVDFITDLAGRTLDYLYDPQGRLESFTDRENYSTQFRYEKSNDPAHPLFHYLTKIIDPRGLPALRCEYDDAGRLRKQIDADGRETVFDRGIDPASGRFEKITDRLGRDTTYFYDERGNIRTKIDALGAVTTFDYYPDSDRVKFEEDHYGNVKGFAYDARGNVTIEVLGASRSEDPASASSGYITRTTYTGFGAPLSITDPDGRLQSFSYDPVTQQLLTHTVGQLAPGAHPEIETATAATTTYTYHPDGTLWTVTDALGNVTTTTYDYGFSDPAYPGAVKRVVTTVVDPAGSAGSDPTNASATTLRTTYAYHDAQENLLANVTPRTLADGSVESIPTRHVYDAENRLRFTLQPDGRISETRYTSFGQTDRTLEWPAGTDLAALVAAGPSGPTTGARVTTHAYDARGNLERTTLPDGTYTATGYDAENRPVWRQDARGRRTFTVYDEVGRPRFTIPPGADDGAFDAAPASATDGRLTNNPRSETIYDLVGRVRFQIDEEGVSTEFTYDDNCACAMRRKEVIQHHPDGNLVTSYDYYPSGQVRSVTDPRGNTTGTRYDSHGRPIRTLLPATDEHPSTETVATYNVLGQRVAAADQEGKLTRYRHDGLGRLVEVRQYIDQALAATDAAFTLPVTAAGVVSTRYAYDEAGNQTAQTDARDHVTRYEHDALGRRLKRTLPSGMGVSPVSEQLRYDAWGDLWQRDDFAGRTTTFGYDTLHRLISKNADPAHPSLAYTHAIARVEYDYDDNGAREAARTYNASGDLLYTEDTLRDERGWIDYKDTADARLDYDYHANGLLKDIVSGANGGVNLGYRYDELNRLAYVDDASRGLPVRTTSYAYNANGSLEALTYANGLRHAYRYDSLNRLRHLDVGMANVGQTAGLAAVLQSHDYRLRPSGHRREILEGPAPSGPFRTINHAYDELYRLVGETITGAGPVGSVGYTLDKVGNREARTSTLAAVGSVSGISFNARDQLSTDNYDPNGNTLTGLPAPGSLLPAPNASDVYDFEDRLIVRTRADLSKVYFGYDADGIRVRKTILDGAAAVVSATSYLVCTNNLTGYAQVMEERKTDASGTTLKTYGYGSDLLSVARSGPGILPAGSFETRYFLYDGGGSVRALADESGTITDRYTYDAFGVLLSHQGSSDNAYLYRGEQYDADLGLTYLRARFYNPDSGRFWNQDTYEGRTTDPASLHKYLYAHANPVSFSDPTGHWTLSEIQAVAFNIGIQVAIAAPRVAFFVAEVAGVSVVGAGAARGVVAVGSAAERALPPGLTLGQMFTTAVKLPKGVAIGSYKFVKEILRGTGKQANHINQKAAFPLADVDDALSVGLQGGTHMPGSEHWRFHRVLEDFWEGFRNNPFVRPTNAQYDDALREALEATDLPPGSIDDLVELARQSRAAKYFDGPGGLPPVVPGPIPMAK